MAVKENLVDAIWAKDKPARPNEPAKVLSEQFAGKAWQAKVDELRKELDKKKSAGFVVCEYKLRSRGPFQLTQ